MALINEPEAAKRTARAIVSDLLQYNRDKIAEGIRTDRLFELMHDELEEGRAYYRSRIHPDLYARTNFFDRAIVDVLIKPMAAVDSKIW
jgi:hypothetical protein